MNATFIKNSARLLAAFLLAAAVGLTGAPAASSDDKEGLGGLEKSIVLLLTQWSGSILVPPSADAAGQGYWTEKLKYSVSCTGWYASATAQIVTAGHCVDPGQGRKVLLDGYLQEQKAANLKDKAYANWRVEGDMGGSPPDRSVRAIQPNGLDGATITSPTTVEVVDVKAPEAGDIALLHVPNMSKETPGLVIAENSPKVGDSVTSIGFPGDLQDIADQSQIARTSFKNGTVSSNQVTPAGVTQTEVSTELAPGMSGGPTVNKDGQVIGVNSRGLTTQAGFNFVTNTADLRSFLTSHNVPLVQPPAPPSTELGTAWYLIGGGVVLAVAGALGALVLLMRRRRPPQFAGGAPGRGFPMQGPPPTPMQGWMPGQPPPQGQRPPQAGPNFGMPAASPAVATGPGANSGGATEPPPAGGSEQVVGNTLTNQTTAVGQFCGSCGATHRPDDQFCPRCGKPVA